MPSLYVIVGSANGDKAWPDFSARLRPLPGRTYTLTPRFSRLAYFVGRATLGRNQSGTTPLAIADSFQLRHQAASDSHASDCPSQYMNKGEAKCCGP
jgi:hypothetical protein